MSDNIDRISTIVPQQAAARLAIVLVTYNAEHCIRQCLESLIRQSFRDFSLIVIDNGSTDGTLSLIEKDFPNLRLIKRRENQGFSKAYNNGIAWAVNCDYVLCLNQDAFLESDYLAELVSFSDKTPEAACVSGKLLRYNSVIDEPTTIIDSLGLGIRRTHLAYNIAEGEDDENNLSQPVEVFGVPATAVLYRRTALDYTALKRSGRNEYFDEDFFAYKEDVDLSWRLRLAGYKSFIVPKAIAYHVRSAQKQPKKERRNRRPLVRQLSYRNHLLTYFANETWINIILTSLWTLPFELAKFIYLLFFEFPTVWYGWSGIIRFFPRTTKKRLFVQKLRRVRSKDIRIWLH